MGSGARRLGPFFAFSSAFNNGLGILALGNERQIGRNIDSGRADLVHTHSLIACILKRGYGWGMALSSEACHLFDRPKFKTTGSAVGYASRFQALVDSVHAVIAFFNRSCLLVPLGRAPGAG
jgi:hypothetical protein